MGRSAPLCSIEWYRAASAKTAAEVSRPLKTVCSRFHATVSLLRSTRSATSLCVSLMSRRTTSTSINSPHRPRHLAYLPAATPPPGAPKWSSPPLPTASGQPPASTGIWAVRASSTREKPSKFQSLRRKEVEEHLRFPIRHLPVEQCLDNFCEISCGYQRLDAMAESLRCLHCDRR